MHFCKISVLFSLLQIGSVGGNLMIKHMHNEFPSDVFLLFDTVGAQLELRKLNDLLSDFRYWSHHATCFNPK